MYLSTSTSTEDFPEMYLSTFEMYLSTSTSTEDFPEMYLSTFQVLYKLYLSTDVLKYKVLLPGSGPYYTALRLIPSDLGPCSIRSSHSPYSRIFQSEAATAL